ncbi:hypothetical protein C8Q78DRAFT_7418 [Trametes maxima]|nr:hypothetical protein C8Q78DRAFT_7418 [Trametes maxima]
MATLARPRISVPVQDVEEPRRPLSMDIPTPFPRLALRTEEPQRRTGSPPGSRPVVQFNIQSGTSTPELVQPGEKSSDRSSEEGVPEAVNEAESTGSVSQFYLSRSARRHLRRPALWLVVLQEHGFSVLTSSP